MIGAAVVRHVAVVVVTEVSLAAGADVAQVGAASLGLVISEIVVSE